jgi:anaerobic selenocysteine-containing dehydrogenase
MFLQMMRGSAGASVATAAGAALASVVATTADSWANNARAKAMKEKDIQDFLWESSECCIAT